MGKLEGGGVGGGVIRGQSLRGAYLDDEPFSCVSINRMAAVVVAVHDRCSSRVLNSFQTVKIFFSLLET